MNSALKPPEKLPRLVLPSGFLVLSKRLTLSASEERSLRRRKALLPHTAPAEGGMAYCHTAASPVPPAQLQAFLIDIACARRMLNCTHEPELRERPCSRSIYYYGHEVLRLDRRTGCISYTWFGTPFVTPLQLTGLRNAVAKRQFIDALCQEFNLDEHDVVLPEPTGDQELMRVSTKGTSAAKWGRRKADPDAPESALLMFGIDAFIRHKLLRQDPLRPRAAQFSRMIWKQFIDRDIAALTMKGVRAGVNFSWDDYNQVAWHLALYRQVEREMPALLPVLHQFIAQQPKRRRWGSARQRATLGTEFFAIRAALRQVGFSKSDWKALLSLKPLQVKRLVSVDAHNRSDFQSNAKPSGVPSILAERLGQFQAARRLGLPVHLVGDLPDVMSRLEGSRRWRWRTAADLEKASAVKAMAIRWASERANKPKDFEVALRHAQYGLARLATVLDWLFNAGFASGFPSDNSTWESLNRRADEWHEIEDRRRRIAEELAAAHRQERLRALYAAHRNPAGEGWNPWLGECTIDGVVVRPLHTEGMLNLEADAQHHCVWDYYQDCWQGDTLIFSLRDVADPTCRSTLELRRRAGRRGQPAQWQNVQLMAACNQAPPEGHIAVAAEVANRVTKLAARFTPHRPARQPDN